MTIFDFIASVLFTKEKTCLASVDEEGNFSPYMLNRWCSMYSKTTATFSNIINRYIGIFEDKRDLYSLFVAVMPKVSSKRISYIKKIKEEKTDVNSDIEMLANNLELSKREINQYIAFLETLPN
jgi:plasmid rolling circle replication initiator protein Rep